MNTPISKPAIRVKQPVGNGVSSPRYGGSDPLIARSGASMAGGSSAPSGASGENRSAKFKRGSQDVPAAGRGQYQ